MAKIVLTDLVNLQNETTAVNAIKNNNDVLEAAMENTLSRDGTSPNQMNATLDMNSHKIINLPTPISNYEPLRVIDRTSLNAGVPITVSSLPTGGIEGQILEKNSGSNFDVKWATVLSATQVTRVANLATLRTATPAVGNVVFMQGYATNGDGGGGTFIWDPLSSATDSGINVQSSGGGIGRWVRQFTFLAPEMFGVIGVNPEGDTTTWNALAAAAVDGDYIVASGNYQIAGNVIFNSLLNITLDLTGSTFQQINRFSKTLDFRNCGNVKIIGGTLRGLGGEVVGSATSNEFCAQSNGVTQDAFGYLPVLSLSRTFIATAGQTAFPVSSDTLGITTVRRNGVDLTLGTQYTVVGGNTVTLVTPSTLNDQVYIIYQKGPAPDTIGRRISGSFNGVAAISFTGCTSVEVSDVRALYHAGGGIGGFNNRYVNCHDNYIEGIGPNYILNGDNGADFALAFTLNSGFSQDFICEWRFVKNRILNHSFGIAGLLTKSLLIVDNYVGPLPGQHGVYASDCNGMIVIGNIFRSCGEICVKLQQENRILTEMGIPAWSAGAYASGAKVIKYLGCYETTLAFTSTDFDAELAAVPPKWVFSEDNHLHDPIIANNVMTDSLYGIQFPATVPVYNTAQRIKGAKINNNVIRNMLGTGGCGMKIERAIECAINDNIITDTNSNGIYLRDCSGSVRNNDIRRTAASGIIAFCSFDSEFISNILEDTGLTVVAAGERIPFRLINTDGNGVAGADTTPTVKLTDNDIRFTSAGLAGVYLLDSDTTYRVDISGTKTTATTATVNVEGTLLRTLDNQFGNFFTADHNMPATLREGRSMRRWYSKTIPTTGTHFAGEWCDKVDAVSGQTVGWLCSIGGTPGTWIPGPNYP